MTRSLLDDAFAHHVWATLRLLDECSALSPKQLGTSVPGTYGSILATMRHLAGGDSLYLLWLTGDRKHAVDVDEMDLRELRGIVERNGAAWFAFLALDPDAAQIVKDVDEGGYVRDASVGTRLAQALHHGTDHRSQICTALTFLGVKPPGIDIWNFGLQTGRIVETPPAS